MKLYFISFRTYGTWLRGHAAGWFGRRSGWQRRPPNAALEDDDRGRLKHQPTHLSEEMRSALEEAIPGFCAMRGWAVLALWVGRTHIHVVLEADRPPESVMHYLKSKCTRALRCSGLLARSTTVWSRHGSTIYLNLPAEVVAAVRYVEAHAARKSVDEPTHGRS